MYIFMDESGDLSFSGKKGNSKIFLITFVAIPDKRPLEKLVKRTHKTLRQKVKKLSGGVLHCVKEKPLTRQRLLTSLNQLDVSIMTIVLEKSRVYTKLHNEKHILYNYVTNILIDRILKRKIVPSSDSVQIIAAKRETNKFLNDNFKHYLEAQTKIKHQTTITVYIETPSSEKGLQAVDFASWALFQKYEHNALEYYSLIKPLVKEENKLFK